MPGRTQLTFKNEETGQAANTCPEPVLRPRDCPKPLSGIPSKLGPAYPGVAMMRKNLGKPLLFEMGPGAIEFSACVAQPESSAEICRLA